ncbi:hypothetical protein ACWGAN_34765 [Streptomyces sp. NPDC054945]
MHSVVASPWSAAVCPRRTAAWRTSSTAASVKKTAVKKTTPQGRPRCSA